MPLILVLRRQRQVDLSVSGQVGLQSKFQDSQGYARNPVSKNRHTNKVWWCCSCNPSSREVKVGRFLGTYGELA